MDVCYSVLYKPVKTTFSLEDQLLFLGVGMGVYFSVSARSSNGGKPDRLICFVFFFGAVAA